MYYNNCSHYNTVAIPFNIARFQLFKERSFFFIPNISIIITIFQEPIKATS